MAHYGKKLFSLIFLLIFAIVLLALFPQCAFAEEEGEKMASYTTAYSASFAARAHNIELAASLLDGQKVGAGAEFSFNAAVGARTSGRGFVWAGEFARSRPRFITPGCSRGLP